MDMS
jgi:ABC-type multidrug transport system ATPase subunit